MKIIYGAIFFTVIFISSCRKPINKFSDPITSKIWDFKDRRIADSLYRYLSHRNVSYRRDAAMALASIQDSTSVDRLRLLILNDESGPVRTAAAFALGQIRCRQSISVLADAFAREKDNDVLREIIESYGKVTRQWALDVSLADTTCTAAIAWSYYRAGLNGIADTAMNANASMLLQPRFSTATRKGSAHYFARGAKDFEKFLGPIVLAARRDISPEVRMAATLALRKIKTDSSLNTAIAILKADADYRVRTNAIRVIQAFPFTRTEEHLMMALADENVNVSIAASEAIKALSTGESWQTLLSRARAATHWRVAANLYEAALAGQQGNKELAEEIMAQYDGATNDYHKAALLTALHHSAMCADFIQSQMLGTDVPVIRSAAASALVAMNYHPAFDTASRKDFSELFIKGIHAGDPGVTGILTAALSDSTLGYRDVIKDFAFLYKAKEKLSLPKDIEALQPLEAAIAYFERRKTQPPIKNEFNHPIDWELVKTIRPDERATISTSKGDIRIRLFVEDSPGSVSNFVALVKQRYYDQKFFHRVVPNFVVQAGCNRGDGFGSEAYSIRSEFSERRYRTGSIGMASAGKDTEGTQWFITHSPTPHLDGYYTIFGEVEEGMDVVDRIEVGDKILKIELDK